VPGSLCSLEDRHGRLVHLMGAERSESFTLSSTRGRWCNPSAYSTTD
jgi:hypothetical protein